MPNRRWMQTVHPKKGALHRALKIPAGERIPDSKLSIHPNDSPLMKKRKELAKRYRGE